ncbi:MAG: TRAP transporter large permease subunit [Casimicrobiaceae bacterium]
MTGADGLGGLAGLAMLGCVGAAMIATGLPTWLLLIGVASVFALGGVLAGAVPAQLLASVPGRVVGLLENDLLQALPLYVLTGTLLYRLPLADVLIRTATRGLRRTGAAVPLAGLALGGVLAPMNGSVGASVLMLGRVLAPLLAAARLPASRSAALIAMASTLGVVIPPSLVLILLGDAMLRAHTEALNITGQAARIVNTQDVFRGALVPAAAVLVLAVAITWWATRDAERAARRARDAGVPAPAIAIDCEATITGRDVLAGMMVLGLIVALLAGVTMGYLYAVEAAATGGVALFLYGIVTRTLTRPVLAVVVDETIAVTGALFALLVGATTFTLVLRGLGTDRLVAAWLTGLPGGEYVPLAAALAVLAACAFVLDAFEMIFVVVPVLLPPVLVRIADPVWVAVLTLLILQMSFLLPPFGYAVQMVRNTLDLRDSATAMARALAPYLIAQVVVIATVIAFPGVLWRGPADALGPGGATPLSDNEARSLMDRQLGMPPTESVPGVEPTAPPAME